MPNNVQVVKINKSILYYFRMMMNFDNESEEFRKVTEQEFIQELTKSLNDGVVKKEIEWMD